jgi:hypothetical protein
MQAVEDAERAAALAPAWPKPLHRLAQALAGLERWAPAVAACRKGAAILGQPPHVYADFALQLDGIAVAAGLQGDLSGFDGRQLEVPSRPQPRTFLKRQPTDLLGSRLAMHVSACRVFRVFVHIPEL